MPLPYPRSAEAPLFTGDNVTAFLHDYKRMVLRYGYPDDRAAMLMEDYCDEGIASQVRSLQEGYPTLCALADAMKERFSQFDKEQYLGTIEALTQYVEEVLRRGQVDTIQYSRAFDRIVRRAQDAGAPIDGAQVVRQYLRGLPRDVQRRVVSKVGISPLCPKAEQYLEAVQCTEHLAREARSLDLLNSPLSGISVLDQLHIPEKVARDMPGQPGNITRPTTNQSHQVENKGTGQQRPDSVDELVEHFRALRLNAVQLGPVVQAAGISGVAFATIVARASAPNATAVTTAEPRYNDPTQHSSAQQTLRHGVASMECYMCGERGHGVRACPGLNRLIDDRVLHWGPANRLCWGTLNTPGSELVGLPRSGRLEAIRRMLRERQVHAAVGNISIQFEDRPDDLSTDDECDQYFVAGTARDRSTPPVTDKDARVHKRQLRPPRVRTSRPGYFIPADGALAPGDPQMSHEFPPGQMTKAPESAGPAGMSDFEQGGPTDEGRKKRQRAVKIMDYLQDHETPDHDIVQRIMALPAPVTIGDCCAKMPGVSKLLFKPLPEELADPMRTKLDERAEVKKALLERRKAERAADMRARGDPQVAAVTLTAREVDAIMGSDIIYRNDSPSVVAGVGPTGTTVRCLLDSGADINVIRISEALAASLPMSSLPPSLAKGRMFVANGEAVKFLGICMSASVKIGDVTIQTPLLVVDKLAWPCILGETFACRASLTTQRTPSGKVTCTITSEDGERTVMFGASPGINRLNREEIDADDAGKD